MNTRDGRNNLKMWKEIVYDENDFNASLLTKNSFDHDTDALQLWKSG